MATFLILPPAMFLQNLKLIPSLKFLANQFVKSLVIRADCEFPEGQFSFSGFPGFDSERIEGVHKRILTPEMIGLPLHFFTFSGAPFPVSKPELLLLGVVRSIPRLQLSQRIPANAFHTRSATSPRLTRRFHRCRAWGSLESHCTDVCYFDL